jgi:hypothetical protein
MSLCHAVETIVKVVEKKTIERVEKPNLVFRNRLDELCTCVSTYTRSKSASHRSRKRPPPSLQHLSQNKRTSVINLIIPRINRALEQLFDLLLGHLLAQVRQDILDLSLADEARSVLVKDLEPPDVLLNVKGLAETARSVQDLGEGFKVD